MNNFNSNIENRSERIKSIKLIHQLRKDTYNDKLKWDILYRDKNNVVITFSTFYKITENKKIIFILRCEEGSKINDHNILRVTWKTNNLKPPVSSATLNIRNMSLNDYPSLIQLIKLLRNIYLEKKPKHLSIVANDLEEYKYQSIDIIKDMINDLTNTIDKEERKIQLNYIMDEILNSKTFDEVNDLLFNAYSTTKDI